MAQLLVAEPVVAVHGQPFVLRAESPSATIGGGRVLQPLASCCSHAAIRRRLLAWAAALGRPIRAAASRPRLARAHRQHRSPALRSCWAWPPGDAEPALATLSASGAIVELSSGPRRTARILSEVVADLEDRVLSRLGPTAQNAPAPAFDSAAACSPVLLLRPSRLPRSLTALSPAARCAAWHDRLGTSARPRLRNHSPKLSQGERKLKAELAEMIPRGGISPPDLGRA